MGDFTELGGGGIIKMATGQMSQSVVRPDVKRLILMDAPLSMRKQFKFKIRNQL